MRPVHQQRIAMLVLAAAGGLGVFLPWVNMPIVGSLNGTVELFTPWGWFVLALFALTMFDVSYRTDRSRPLDMKACLVAATPSLSASTLATFKMVSFHLAMEQVAFPSSDAFSQGFIGKAIASSVSLGAGAYLIAAMGPAVLVAGATLRGPALGTGSKTLDVHPVASAVALIAVLFTMATEAAFAVEPSKHETMHSPAPALTLPPLPTLTSPPPAARVTRADRLMDACRAASSGVLDFRSGPCEQFALERGAACRWGKELPTCKSFYDAIESYRAATEQEASR